MKLFMILKILFFDILSFRFRFNYSSQKKEIKILFQDLCLEKSDLDTILLALSLAPYDVA